MGRPTRENSLFKKLEQDLRKILDDPEAKVTDRLGAVNATIKLIDLKRALNEDQTDNFFGSKS